MENSYLETFNNSNSDSQHLAPLLEQSLYLMGEDSLNKQNSSSKEEPGVVSFDSSADPYSSACQKGNRQGSEKPLEVLVPDQLSSRVDGFFNKIDLDKNGLLSGSELDRAANDPQYTKFNEQAIETMRQNRDGLAKVSDDQLFFDSEISRRDLSKISQIATPGADRNMNEINILVDVLHTLVMTADKQKAQR